MVEEEIKPSLDGKDCLYNGLNEKYECCCDECNYFLFCYPDYEDKSSIKRLSKNGSLFLINRQED